MWIHLCDRQSSWCHIPVHAIMFPTGTVPTNGAQMFWATEWVIRWVWWWWCWCVFRLRTSCWITVDITVANAKWAETLGTSHSCNFTYQMHGLCNGNVSIAYYRISWEDNHKHWEGRIYRINHGLFKKTTLLMEEMGENYKKPQSEKKWMWQILKSDIIWIQGLSVTATWINVTAKIMAP